MARRVFVVGANGQDGTLLAENVAASGGIFAGVDRGHGGDGADELMAGYPTFAADMARLGANFR